MVEIYAIKIVPEIKKELLTSLLSLISIEKKIKIEKYHFQEDMMRSLLGDLLVRSIICEKFDENNKNIYFQRNEFGKPYLIGYPNFHFNISHSGVWVVCAVSNDIVGIDIEEIKYIDLSMAKHFFTEREYKVLTDMNKAQQLNYFYEIWTLKECYVKYLGKGLSVSLRDFCVVKEDVIEIISEQQIPNGILSTHIDGSYKVAVCSEEDIINNDIKILDISYIVDKLFGDNITQYDVTII